MIHHAKHLATLIATTLALALAVSNAAATHLRVSNQNIRATWTSLQLSNTVNAETILCPVTIEGSFHNSTIAKTVGALIGYVTRASISATCTGGSATIHQESLPWHITYEGFTGTLPNIATEKLLVIGAFFEIALPGGTQCSARSELEHPVVVTNNLNLSTHAMEALAPEPNTRIPLTNGNGGIFCGLANGILSGTSTTLTQLGSTTQITLTLI